MTYTVKDNWLYQDSDAVQNVYSEKAKYTSGSNICDYIVYHFTVTNTARSAHNTFKNRNVNVSWHLTVDTDGSLYQLYDFRKITWHAGRSTWTRPNGQLITGLNRWAIGIEVINCGPLTKQGNDYFNVYNQEISSDQVFQDGCTGKYWQSYSDAQLETIRNITPVLIDKYNCVDVLGHEEISPGRKIDPGPAFDQTLRQLKDMI